MNALKGSGKFWYDFIIGDDWKIAVAVVSVLAAVLGLVALGVIPSGAATVVGAMLMLACFVVGLIIDVRTS